MKDEKILPFDEPPLLTYHNQACVGVAAMQSPGGMNWYLNNAVQMSLEKKYLGGYTTPLLKIVGCHYTDISVIRYETVNLKYIYKNFVDIVMEMINRDNYVLFYGADDYYLEGKSWYQSRHFIHDGLIIGYSLEDRTFTVVAYDKSWLFRSFSIPMACFIKAYEPMPGRQVWGWLTSMRPLKIEEPLEVRKIIQGIRMYLDSDYKKYPPIEDGNVVYGIIVLKYLADYLTRIKEGQIPVERMDRRIMRLLMDHKALMKKRLLAVCEELGIKERFDVQYQEIVDMVESLRFQYKRFELKPSSYSLTRMIAMMYDVYEKEKTILEQFVFCVEGVIEKEINE